MNVKVVTDNQATISEEDFRNELRQKGCVTAKVEKPRGKQLRATAELPMQRHIKVTFERPMHKKGPSEIKIVRITWRGKVVTGYNKNMDCLTLPLWLRSQGYK